MTDTTEQKALALVEECSEYGALYKNYREVPNSLFHKALCRAADRIEALTAENERLRVQLADLANTINIVGSHYHKAQVALDDLVLDVKKRARAALQKETAETFTRSDNV